jgi:hypothetical protein
MKILHGTSIALGIAGAILSGALLPARAADQPIVKAPVAAPVVVCSNLNWSHGWLDHGGWGGWGYQDGLVVNGWPGSCSVLVGVGPYAMAPRDSGPNKHAK